MKTLPRQSLRLLVLLLCGATGASAQQVVTGRVVSEETLAPLNGVLVTVQGAERGVLTNSDGRYSIAAAGDATLVFTLIGYATQEIAVANRQIVNAELATTALMLDEIVAVGYGTQSRASVSGAVSSLDTEEIVKSSASTTADMIVGKVAGINARLINTRSNTSFQGRVPRDGRPGAAAVIQVRNMGDPLFVVDGVPVTPHEFNQINAQDIDNISILKDASATIYGFRASNGVVLVTTKRGTGLRTPQLRLDGYYGWQNIARSRSPFGYANSAYQFKYSIIESQQNRGQERTISPEEMEKWRLGGPGYESYEAWNGVVNNPNAMNASLNASLSGGGGGASYYLSAGHVAQEYVMNDNDFSRTNVQANLESELFTGFTIGTQLRGRLEKHITTAETATSDPITVHFKAIQSTWPHENWYANNNPDYVNGDVRYLIRSPAIMNRSILGTQDQIRTNIAANFFAEYVFPFGLSAKATYSRTSDLEEFDVHRYSYDAYCYDAGTDTYNVCDSSQGQIRRHIRDVGKRDFGQIQLSQSHTFGDHNLSGVVAYEVAAGEGVETFLESVPPTNFTDLIDLVDVIDAETNWNIERRASYIGRVNYDFRQKYLVELLARYDGSHLYAPSKRWGLFPGVSVGWRITEEPFFRDNIGFIDELKLRASWGQTGREQANPWNYLEGASYGVGNGSVLDEEVVTGIRPRGLPSTNLSWVTATTRNLGVDFAFLDRKVAGSVDLFERRLSGIPAQRYDVLLPLEVGYDLPDENLNSQAIQGIEGMVTFTDRIGNVNFSIAPNATLARQKILDLYKPRYGNSLDRYFEAEENRWANVNFNLHAIGQFQNVEEIMNYPVNIDGRGNTTLLPGDLIFEDVNGDGIIDDLDERPRGYSAGGLPILSFGLNGTFEYRGLSLSYNFAGGAMFSFSPGSDLRIPYTSDHNGGAYIWSRWRRVDPYDDNSEWIPGKYPPLRKAQNSHSSYRNSDFTYTNVKYLRINRVELGYEFPTDLANRIRLSQLRVYTSAANPYLFDNTDWAMDPEVSQCCGQVYPTPTIVNVGFTASLGGTPTSSVAVPVPPAGDDD